MSSLAAAIEDVPTGSDAVTASDRAAIASQLATVLGQLHDPRRSIESAFLDVGRGLGDCAGQLQAVTALFESLPRQLESEEVTTAMTRLEAVTGKMQAMAASFGTEGDSLGRLMGFVTAVGGPIDELSDTMRAMNVVSVYARIAAVQLTNEQDDLSVFTTDIARLSQNASETIKRFATTYDKLVGVLQVAIKEWKGFEPAHKATLDVLTTSLGNSLAVIGSHCRQAAEVSTETGKLSRQIAERVGSAVYALQIGDITRQRVEHVEEALNVITDAPDTNAAGDQDEAVIAAICRLQSAQLGQAIDDFERETRQIAQALQELADDAQRAVAQSQGMYGSKDEDNDSFLKLLSAELRKACGLMESYGQAQKELDRAAAAVSDSVKEMLGYVEAVRRIEADLRIVSLNMTLKCCHLGIHGRALNVIAHELRELVLKKTVAAASAVTAHLQEAAGLAQAMGDGLADRHAEQITVLEEEARLSIAPLEAVDASLTEALAQMARDGAGIVQLLQDASADVATCDQIAEALRGGVEGIDRLAAICGDGRGQDTADTMERALAKLGGRYTMASERLLHSRMAEPSLAADPQPAAASAAGGDDLDSLFL